MVIYFVGYQMQHTVYAFMQAWN